MSTPNVLRTSNDCVEEALQGQIIALEKSFDCDMLVLNGMLIGGVDDLVRDLIEEMRRRSEPRDRLAIILTTNGGYLAPVIRIVDTIRHHYRH